MTSILAAPVQPLLLRPLEAAKALGISERKLWQMTKDGLIPFVPFGRSVRYAPADLQAWIDSAKKWNKSVKTRGAE